MPRDKDKKRFLDEAKRIGGIAVDMCKTCPYNRIEKTPYECLDCASGWRQLPGWPVEDYRPCITT